MALISKSNLQEKSLTNAEVIAMLNKLSFELDHCGFTRTIDVIEDLTGDRLFDECQEVYDAKKTLALKVTKATTLG